MTFFNRFRIPLLVINFSILIFNSYGGGFQVNLQGQKQTGMGHTGTGYVTDAATIFFNPGGIGWLDTMVNLSGGISFIIPRTQFLEAFPGTYTAEMIHNTGTPFEFYYSASLNKNIYAGVGIYTPFGSRAQWDDDWKGQFIIREINLKTIFIQPTLSWKINDNFGIGAGFIIATGDFALRKGVPVQNLASEYGEGTLEGNASGTGVNAGVYFASGKLSAGINYRSSVTAEVNEGDAAFSVPSYLEQYFPQTKFSASINLPSVLSLGAGYKLSNKITLAADVNLVGWSSYDSLRINFETNTEKLEDISSARNYKDVFIYRLGAEYFMNDKIALRAGIYYDTSPVPDGYLTPETPDSDRVGLTAGCSFNLKNNLRIDLSVLYNQTQKRTDTNLETGFSGTYQTKTIIPGIGFSYMF